MIELVCMRLADMWRIHPRQDDSRVCSKCGEQVGIYPSGQNALRHNKGMKIICSVCAEASSAPAEAIPAAPMAEIRQEMRDSKDAKKP